MENKRNITYLQEAEWFRSDWARENWKITKESNNKKLMLALAHTY